MRPVYKVLIFVFIVLIIVFSVNLYKSAEKKKKENIEQKNEMLLKANNNLKNKGIVQIGAIPSMTYDTLTVVHYKFDKDCKRNLERVAAYFNGEIIIEEILSSKEEKKKKKKG